MLPAGVVECPGGDAWGWGWGGVSSPTRWADPSLRAPAPRHGPAATPGPCIQVPLPPLHHSLPQAGARGRRTHAHHSPKDWRRGAVVAVGRGALFISKIIPQRKILYATQSKESSPLMKTKTCPKDFARAPLVEQAPWFPRPVGGLTLSLSLKPSGTLAPERTFKLHNPLILQMGKLMLRPDKGLPKAMQHQWQTWGSGPGAPTPTPSTPLPPQAHGHSLTKAVPLRANWVPPLDTRWHS